MSKTQKDFEREDEQAKLMHVLSLPEVGKGGICLTHCGDELCSHGCLQQRAYNFRPQIMQAIKICRAEDWYKYPLYVPFENEDLVCSFAGRCKDPVCQVAGCLQKPAWEYRHLIRIALREKKINE